MAPIHSQTSGLGAVPVWFVDWAELAAALSDHVLTIEELAALPSLQVGLASFYQETLHPLDGAQVNSLKIVAQGVLEDGTPFRVHFVDAPGVTKASISFK